MDDKRLLRQDWSEYHDVPPPVFRDLDTSLLLRHQRKQIIMFNIGGTHQRPVTAEPALRILGAFRDLHAAQRHYDRYFKTTQCAVHVTDLGRDVLLAHSFDDQYDDTYVSMCISTAVERARKNILSRYEEHRHRRANYPDTPDSVVPEASTTMTSNLDTSESVLDTTLMCCDEETLGASAQIARQTVCVVGLIAEAEPVITFYGVFATVQDAKQFIKDILSTEVLDRPVYIVDCYEWLYPLQTQRERVQQEEWRHQDETDIMIAHTEQDKVSKAFRATHKQNE